MSNPEYVKTVFGSEDIPVFFARYRKRFKKNGMTRKKVLELVVCKCHLDFDQKWHTHPGILQKVKIIDRSDGLLPP